VHVSVQLCVFACLFLIRIECVHLSPCVFFLREVAV